MDVLGFNLSGEIFRERLFKWNLALMHDVRFGGIFEEHSCLPTNKMHVKREVHAVG